MCFRWYNRYPGCNCDLFAYIEPCEKGSVTNPCDRTESRIIDVDFGRCYYHCMTDYTPINNQRPSPGPFATPPFSEDEAPVTMANSAPARPLGGMEFSNSDSDWSNIDQDAMLAEADNHDEEEKTNSDSDDFVSAPESPVDESHYIAYGESGTSDSDDHSATGGATDAGSGIEDHSEALASTEYESRNIASDESDNTGTDTIMKTDIEDPDAPISNKARRAVARVRAKREARNRKYFARICRRAAAHHQAMLEQQQQELLTITAQSLHDDYHMW